VKWRKAAAAATAKKKKIKFALRNEKVRKNLFPT
jgi:hypothetical protein